MSVFKENIGELIRERELRNFLDMIKSSKFPIITIGDTTTLTFLTNDIVPDLSIVDLGTRRGELEGKDLDSINAFLQTGDVTKIRNPAETITEELWNAVSHACTKFKIGRPERKGTIPAILRIIGEEDLASLPCIYFCPDKGHVLYGLPDKGMVHIQVEPEHKKIVHNVNRVFLFLSLDSNV